MRGLESGSKGEFMSTAEDVFSETFGRFMSNWSFIFSLRHISEVVLPLAPKTLAPANAEIVEIFAADPNYNKIFVNLDGSWSPWSEKFKGSMSADITAIEVSNARKAIDAASLVFAQSMLDDSAWSYCQVCALIAPQDWEPFVEAKKIDFAAVRSKSSDAIRDELVQVALSQLERESLLKKVDMLFRLCNPPKGFAPIDNYIFDRDRLEAIDNKRHLIIHANGLKAELQNIDDDLEYIRETSVFLMGLVHQKYGVQIHPLKALPNSLANKTARHD
jgi:hypothetical protein